MKNRKYTNEFKECVASLYSSGRSISNISKDYNIPKSNIVVWAKKFQKIYVSKSEDITINKILELKKELEKVKEENDILKNLNNCYEKNDLVEKIKFINENKEEYSVNYLCDTLDISTSTYYRYINNKSLKEREEAYLKKLIMDIYRENRGIYGVNKIYFALRKKGVVIGRRKVQKIMKELNLYSTITKRYNNKLI
ncbi:MAG: IS3 family transposase [Clostridium perfringens]|nr:IS3 family transposase [Clostridium perfringens]